LCRQRKIKLGASELVLRFLLSRAQKTLAIGKGNNIIAFVALVAPFFSPNFATSIAFA